MQRQSIVFRKLLAKIASALTKNHIDYMVIGGQAVLIHGEPRFTTDIDITLGIGTDHLPEIIDIVNQCALQPLVDSPSDFANKTMVLPVKDNLTNIRIDFIFSTSAYEKIALKRAIAVKIDDTEIKYSSIEDLIIHKIVAGRPRDIEDARTVMTKNRNYDIEYIKDWLLKFDKSLDTDYIHSFTSLIKNP